VLSNDLTRSQQELRAEWKRAELESPLVVAYRWIAAQLRCSPFRTRRRAQPGDAVKREQGQLGLALPTEHREVDLDAADAA
jgi:hypothetical protein